MNAEPQRAAQGASLAAELDAVALARLRELDPDGSHDVLRRVFKAFATSLARMLEQLPDAGTRGDAAVVASITHTLKSSAASVGASELASICGEIERRLRAGEPGSLVQDTARLSQAGAAALAAAQAMLAADAPPR